MARKLEEFINESVDKPASKEIENANVDIADEIINGKFCVGGNCDD